MATNAQFIIPCFQATKFCLQMPEIIYIFRDMNRTLILLGFIFFPFVLCAQQVDTTLLIIPCVSGNLFIDGLDRGNIGADDVHREKMTFGDHYVQLKTPAKKYNATLKVDGQIQSLIFKIGCDEQPMVNNVPSLIRVLDKRLALYGLLSQETEKNYIALDQGDELVINCSILNKKGNAGISVTSYETGAEIYRNNSFYSLENQHIKIPQKGVYILSLYTDALFGKQAAITADRAPSLQSAAGFKTTVHIVSDTSSVEVLNTTVHVFSTLSGHINKTALKVNLPGNTSYWVYWIGVGQQARQQMKTFITQLSNERKFFTADPLVLVGMKLLPSLPFANMPSTCSYRFASSADAQKFTAGQQYSYYTFKYADNISSDYSIISTNMPDLALCMENKSSMVGEDVDVRVVAFIVKTKLAVEE